MNREKETETEKAGAILIGKLVPEKKGKKIPLKEPGYATVTRLGKEFHYLVTANESSKLTDLSKESRKKLEKLGKPCVSSLPSTAWASPFRQNC